MANRHRGEINAVMDGKTYKLCLTLGALAELEGAFGKTDMLALAERFSTGRLSAQDAIRILGAGLRGGGNEISDAMVARMRVENGAAGFVEIVARLLEVTFADPAEGDNPGVSDGLGVAAGEAAAGAPFPGAT